MKASTLREMTDDELSQRLNEKRQALWAFRLQSATGSVENVRAARSTRRDVARIMTVMRERSLKTAKEAAK